MTELDSANKPGMTEINQKSADQKFCFSCSKVLHSSATNCPTCGAQQPAHGNHIALNASHSTTTATVPLMPNHVYCRGCGTSIHESAHACPECGAVQRSQGGDFSSGSERITAALLAFFLGWLGVHKFYLGKGFQGILYLLYCWTFIPAIISFIEGIVYLTRSDIEFKRKYP